MGSLGETLNSTHLSEADPQSSEATTRYTPSGDPIAEHIDANELKTSLPARVAYLKAFIGFRQADIDSLKKAAPVVIEVIPGLVDALYSKLFEFDITKKVFMTRNTGFEGKLPTKLEDLTLDSAQIKFRKVYMKIWATRVMSSDYTSPKVWEYMDKVGVMHTGVLSFKKHQRPDHEPLKVPYRDCAMGLGLVQDLLQTGILRASDDKLSTEDKIAAVSAVNKILWMQNDLFARHYVVK